MIKRTLLALGATLLCLTGCGRRSAADLTCEPRQTRAEGFVYVEGQGFRVDGEEWFPVMLNYKVESDLCPAHYYGEGSFREHFKEMAQMGFNAVRVCLDVVDLDLDTAVIFSRIESILDAADSAGLRVMALIKPPLDAGLKDYTQALLRRFSDNKTLWAYDFFNEPLYFDPEPRRDKEEAYMLVREWQEMMTQMAPHQLFTIGFAEPIEVFEWDPSILPVDFVEVHTYHPLRVANEMYWYARYVGRPWMVGETALPADDEEVGYEAQVRFLRQSFQLALDLGACGYGWWEFGDCPQGVNFEAQFAGMKRVDGSWKPVAYEVAKLPRSRGQFPGCPSNFRNMLLYKNICHCGEVRDELSGLPIEGAVVRGWNEHWSVGMNTFTDENGCFELWSNDLCTHWEISAPGYTKAKFDCTPHFDKRGKPVALPYKEREYQQIPLMEGMEDTLFFQYTCPSLDEPVGRCQVGQKSSRMVCLRPLKTKLSPTFFPTSNL